MQAFLDSSVFLYAAGKPHPLKEPCVAILEAVGRGDLDATASTEVVQEVLYVVSRRGNRRLAADLAESIMDLFPELLPVTAADMRLACRIVGSVEGVPSRDAVHAATMLNNGLVNIVTADRDFDRIPDVRRIPPGDL